jgi:hypothetical protein
MGQEIVVKPGAGKPIGESAWAAVTTVLSDYDPKARYLAVFVWPDSFEQFGLLRDAMEA